MKTPMQEVFAQLRASKESDSFGEAYCVDWLLENEKSMLEKEEEVINNAYSDGVDNGRCLYPYECYECKDYYNETFKTNER